MENRQIRESKVRMQVRVEQEEEYISNMCARLFIQILNLIFQALETHSEIENGQGTVGAEIRTRGGISDQ